MPETPKSEYVSASELDKERLKELIRVREEEVRNRTEAIRLSRGLPFLWGFKHYRWSREFFESRNRMNFLCAANQIGKSSTQIRKAIHWATATELWPELWPLSPHPDQFWYFYPGQKQINREFKHKWKQFLPAGEFKDHPIYGWNELTGRNGDIEGIAFNSGVTIYFLTYKQDLEALQTGTVYALFCDEEMPAELYDELIFRVTAVEGYFHMVFTATLGQEFWRVVMEPDKEEEEKFPEAAKWIVSLYDCQLYEDGTVTKYTDKFIAGVRAKCGSHNEILRRVYGRFVTVKGRKIPSFDASKHIKQRHPIPKGWLFYAGLDHGGGGKSHPAAVVFLAVRPDFRMGRVFIGWRGDDVETTAGDTFNKWRELRDGAKITLTRSAFDWGAKDLGLIAQNAGESLEPADKKRDAGDDLVDTLFKFNVLAIYEDPELSKLARELATLKKETPKKHAKDDFYDALRYACMAVPWDTTFLSLTEEQARALDDGSAPETPVPEMDPEERQLYERRHRGDPVEVSAEEAEFEFWNSLHEG